MPRVFSPLLIGILAIVALGLVAIGIAVLDDHVDLGESLPMRVLRGTRMEARVTSACEAEARQNVATPATFKVAVRNVPRRTVAVDRFASVDDVWEYTFEVDAQNVFGAMIRGKVHCTYQDRQVVEIGPV